MGVFGEYSKYYDMFYRDKDYKSEAEYVHGLVQRFRPGAASLLDLGCGTGRHDALFAGMGYDVVGVDMSEASVKAARSSHADTGVEFVQGDARSVRLGRRFDAVVSLFHVMSYQTTDESLLGAFSTAREHLQPGGVFVFDCWYGPGVLTEMPEVREREFREGGTTVRRLAVPTMHANENLVDVDYTITVVEDGMETANFREKHVMRYLFRPEVELMLGIAGFVPSGCFAWMGDAAPGPGTWNACFAARKA